MGATQEQANRRVLATLNRHPHPLATLKSATGGVLANASGSGIIWLALDTNKLLPRGETANNSTTTSVGWAQVVVGQDYVDGGTGYIYADTSYIGSATVGASTIDFSAYLVGSDGTIGSDVVETAAQSVPAAGTFEFSMGTALAKGQMYNVKITLVTIASTAAALNMQINGFGLKYLSTND